MDNVYLICFGLMKKTKTDDQQQSEEFEQFTEGILSSSD